GVRDRETIQLPARGIDVIGVEEAEEGARLILVIGEVKVSDEAGSPPAVVDAAVDSLRNQHLAHIRDLQQTANKIWNQSRLALDLVVRNLFFTAAYLLEEQRLTDLDLVAYSLLVRPTNCHTERDFGSFRSAQNDYAPARIRFIVVCIPDRV